MQHAPGSSQFLPAAGPGCAPERACALTIYRRERLAGKSSQGVRRDPPLYEMLTELQAFFSRSSMRVRDFSMMQNRVRGDARRGAGAMYPRNNHLRMAEEYWYCLRGSE